MPTRVKKADRKALRWGVEVFHSTAIPLHNPERVAAHDVQVYLLDAVAKRADLVAELTRLMQERGHPTH